ncbi:hypothetical protein BM221_001053 [Beauveria bassiana]|uniref:Stress-response A/B barrel domain-containing protein n=1 Tax=Beauveria bassiana TaxID=176275 RepID=A0A2N6P2A2_BEABA|nr:hypothetical protein BM221_001053 [Beauveria bassiana]
MADRVHRVTMFKIPDKENQAKLIAAYAKDGKPYIKSLIVGSAEKDPRSQGYTVVCKTEFASMDDMKFYDDGCPAHSEFKATARGLGVEGIMTTYFTPELIGGSP